MQRLIGGSAANHYGAGCGFWIMHPGSSAWELNVCTTADYGAEEWAHNHHAMAFRGDVVESLRDHGRLPFETVWEPLKLVKDARVETE